VNHPSARLGAEFSVGLFGPFSRFEGEAPEMDRELALAERAERAGFDALWVRDVPTYWPKFGEGGQIHDPWVYLSALATRTEEVTLATGSVVLPLRHPLHVAKAAASVDRLSGGRLVLGVGSGDRDPEYAAFDVEPGERGERFRESVDAMRAAWTESFPEVEGRFGSLDGTLDVRPTPVDGTVPLLVTGHARQELDWIGANADGWLFYQLPERTLAGFLDDWRDATPEPRPFAMGLGVDLADDPDAGMEPIHQGFSAGSEWFVDYFGTLRELGVDHVAVGLRGDDPERAMDRFAEDVLSRL
jgi:luciferase-type oxidoreductase